MSETTRTLLHVPGDYRSAVVALFLAQLDDQNRRLVEETAPLTPAELEWQPAPGMSTMGMLLAHIAVAEVHLTFVGVQGEPDSDVSGVIGIRIEDDGMPLPADGRPPAALQGKNISFFHDLLARARAHTREVARGLNDADLDREIVRERPDGSVRVLNPRWGLYHILEHEAGHFGQILQLRHWCRSRMPERQQA